MELSTSSYGQIILATGIILLTFGIIMFVVGLVFFALKRRSVKKELTDKYGF
ncbi:MAG: hypothetical protein K6E53_15750 [Lachnospiraceae bacterium]|nr:hypothetical protein [Lachnospiraceae bacterium]